MTILEHTGELAAVARLTTGGDAPQPDDAAPELRDGDGIGVDGPDAGAVRWPGAALMQGAKVPAAVG